MARFIRKAAGHNEGAGMAGDYKNTPEGDHLAFGEKQLMSMPVSDSLAENIDTLNRIAGKNGELVIRYITLGRRETRPAAIIYLNSMVDENQVESYIIRPLVLDAYSSGISTSDEMIGQLQSGNLIPKGQTRSGKNFNDVMSGILNGEVGIVIEQETAAYIINAQGYQYRNLSEPVVEPVVRGPKEAFIESVKTNVGMVRRRIASPNLIFETMKIGRVGKNKVCLAYIRGICPEELSDEVRSRLKRIDIDGVLESSYIEELVQDHPYSVFPQVRNTERPDVVASALLEGRAAVMIDNTPEVLIVPGEFFSLMQTPEDYYNRYGFSSLIRILRYFCLFLATLLPALYVAITNYHQEMLPTGLLVSIISARAQVPFPAIVETLILEVTFEILREAGVRLPRPIGQAVSIVGALVIGQAAVQANLVSPLMVIVVALTGIANFCIPQFNIALPVRIIRFPLMLLAASFGLFGVMIGVLFILLHLFSMESFGKPYMTPLAPFRAGDMKDTAVRFPWWSFVRRPAYSSRNSQRMRPGQAPHPPGRGGERQ